MDKGGRHIDMWVMVVGGYNSVGTKLVFNTQAKISGAISIAFSEFLSPQNKGEFDPVVLLQQQDHGKKRYGHMRTHAHTHTHVYTNICMNISICIQRESQQGCESQSASQGTKEARKKKEDERDNITVHSAPSAPSQDSDRLQAAHVPPSLSERPVLSAEVLIKSTRFFGIKERKADVELN